MRVDILVQWLPLNGGAESEKLFINLGGGSGLCSPSIWVQRGITWSRNGDGGITGRGAGDDTFLTRGWVRNKSVGRKVVPAELVRLPVS